MGITTEGWVLNLDGNVVPRYIYDDRHALPSELVKQIVEWLESRLPEFKKDGLPTDQLITPAEPARFLTRNGKAQPTETLPIGVNQKFEFEVGTFEVIRRLRGVPQDKTEYLHARCRITNMVIAGPLLRCHKIV